MVERFPRPKVATYHVWHEGEARFASCADVAWSIESGKPGTRPIEVGEDVEVTNDCGRFAAKFAGVFAKEGAECPVVRVDEPPLAYYVLGAWSDAGDGNLPPAFALRSEGRMPEGIRYQAFAADIFPGAPVVMSAGEGMAEALAAGEMVLAWDADAHHLTRIGRQAPDCERSVRAKRIGRRSVSGRSRSSNGFMSARFSPESPGSGTPFSEKAASADGDKTANGVMREEGAPVDGTTVALVPLPEFGEGCADFQAETGTGEQFLAYGAPSRTFAANHPCRPFDGLSVSETSRGGPPESGEPLCPRAATAGRSTSSTEIRPVAGSKEETETREPSNNCERDGCVAERESEGKRWSRLSDRRRQEEEMMRDLVHSGPQAAAPSREKGRVGRALARIARAGAGLLLLGASLAAEQMVLARAANAQIAISDISFPENPGTAWIAPGN